MLVGAAQADDVLNFNVAGTNPDGSTYSGTVEVTELHQKKASGDVFSVVWTVSGAKVEGVGMVSGEDRMTLAVGYPTRSGGGVLLLKLGSDMTAKGEWMVQGAPGIGTEIWTPAK